MNFGSSTKAGSYLVAAALSALMGCSTSRDLQATPPYPRGKGAANEESFIGVRVLKVEGAGEMNWSAQLPENCGTCRLQINKFTSGQNPKEFYFHFFAASAIKVVSGTKIAVDSAKIRAVLIGHSRVPFHRTSDGIIFDAPQNGPKVSELTGFKAGFHTLPADGPVDVTDQYTYLETPGVETRIEHADEQRRNGYYMSGPWPAIERQAALNLEFAAREAIISLGLDREVRERGLGTILLMGFDTNFPTMGPEEAHVDYPPHWHMHLSWVQTPTIREVAHFNIGPDGLLIENQVWDDARRKSQTFKRGETQITRTASGEAIYSQTITTDGYFELATAAGVCRAVPVGTGFQSGAEIDCNTGMTTVRIRAEDNTELGRLRVFRNDSLVEEHSYDPDNGILKRSEVAYGGLQVDSQRRQPR
jgi:hypothetical protein